MKRSLEIVDGAEGDRVATPLTVGIGARMVTVIDTGNGRVSRTFVETLRQEAAHASGLVAERAESRDDILIVIRSPIVAPKAHRRAEDLEREADVILGSARPAFARYLVAGLDLRRLG